MTYIPTNGGTFFSLSGSGPMPVDLFPSLSLYTMPGETNFFWIDDSSGGGFALDDPAFPGPGGGATNDYTPDTSFNQASFIFSYTTNVWQYTNYWLQISSDSTSNTQVTVVDTIPGLFYQVQTNSNLLSTNWIPWTNLLASTQNTPAPLLNLGTNQLFFRGKIVLPGGSLLTNGLVAYWKMNDATGTNAADSSGYGNTLSLVGSPYWGPGSLILDGSTQYGDASSSTLNNLDQHDKTVCAWINLATNVSAESYFVGIVDKSLSSGAGGWFFAVSYLDQLAWWVDNEGGTFYDSGPGVLVPNQWEFVTVTWSYASNRASFYINGLFNSSVTLGTAERSSAGQPLSVGTLQEESGGGANSFQGSIRCVGIYDRVLSAAEVESNFLSTAYSTNVAVPDLLYYKLNTGSSLTTNLQYAPDSSTIGTNTGTIYGVNGSDIEWTNGINKIPDVNDGINDYGALHFHGAGGNYIDTGNTNLFQFTTNLFTINFWIAPYTPSEVIMQTGINKTNGWYIANSINNATNDNTYGIYFGTETNGNEAVFQTPLGSPGSAHDAWTMVSLVRDSLTNATFYINGLPEISGRIGIPAPSTTSLQIGKTPVVTDRSFDGDMWGIQIWNEPLSAASIASLYLATSNALNYP